MNKMHIIPTSFMIVVATAADDGDDDDNHHTNPNYRLSNFTQ